MRGAILFNGNAESEEHLVQAAAPLLLSSRHIDPEVAASRRTLLITAGWDDGEHDERHIKTAINAIGLASQYEGGFDRTLVNLSLLKEQRDLLAAEPALSEAWTELRQVVATARRFYLEHNAHVLALFRRTLAEAKAREPALTLPRLIAESARALGGHSLAVYALARELRQAFQTLEANDDHLFELLGDIERRAFNAAGIDYHPGWRAARATLESRILSANSILLLGGRLDLLLDAFRFFRLRDAVAEALRRGTQIVAMSAGAMALCERIIVYDDFAETRRDFQLYDRGLEIVREIQLLPHCMERIQTDDPDNLAYLARRFRHHVCVGLNQRSFLLLTPGSGHATSQGEEDGAYVFGPDGHKRCYRAGEVVSFS
jgi:hypothetical protein